MSEQLPSQSDVDRRNSLAGWVPSLATAEQRREAFDKAFDYRGDVTIRTTDGREIKGYVFDRRSPKGGRPYVRVMPSDGGERLDVLYDDIVSLDFSGRDTAAGKSWETWVRKYSEKKAKGQKATLEPESLDD